MSSDSRPLVAAWPSSSSWPTVLPGGVLPTLWLDGGQLAYSDAGVTLATVPYGRVQQIAQPSPLAGSWSASGNARPWRDPSGLDLHAVNASVLTQPSSVAIPANNCTLFAAWHHRLGQGVMSPILISATGHSTGCYFTSGLLMLSCPAGLIPVTGIPSPVVVAGRLTAKCTLIITCTPTQYEFRLTVNGTAYTTVMANAPPTGSLGTVQIGQAQPDCSASGPMGLSQWGAYSRALTSAEMASLQAFLLANPAADPPTTAPLVVKAGDSICAAWTPGWQASLDGNATPPRVLNIGVAGAHTSVPGEIPSYYTTDGKPYYSVSRAKNFLAMEGISINDLGLFIGGGDSASVAAAKALTSYYAYLDKAKADGWIVIAFTLSPNTNGAVYDSARAIINADIRANYAAHAAYLFDAGAVVNMATSADAANTTYFYDGTHPTASGYALWDAAFLPVITAALAA